MKKILFKMVTLVLGALTAGFVSRNAGLNFHQAMSVSIFSASIMGTLFFWELRLSFAFLGSSLLLMTKAVDLESFLRMTTLEVVLFLAGMMIVVALLKDSGFFAWIVARILRVRRLTGLKFTWLIIVISAVLACVVDEVTSIIFMVAAILEICDYYEVDPIPFVIISIMATNIGSAATVLGNPIGILIATKAGLSFEDFLAKALPLACVSLVAFTGIMFWWFRKPIREMTARLEALQADEILLRLIAIPMDRQLRIGMGIFGIMIVAIAFHHRLEVLMGLERNTLLLIMPLITAGIIMMWKPKRARAYVEHGIEWWTLLFFMLLFAQAGTLKYTGATDIIAMRFLDIARESPGLLTGIVLWGSSIGSSLLDNVIVVVTSIPVIKSFFEYGVGTQTLWWALLFGGCLGGNITLIGSTANIVAIGILEKEKHVRIGFGQWIGVGLVVGLTTTAITWVILTFVPYYSR